LIQLKGTFLDRTLKCPEDETSNMNIDTTAVPKKLENCVKCNYKTECNDWQILETNVLLTIEQNRYQMLTVSSWKTQAHLKSDGRNWNGATKG